MTNYIKRYNKNKKLGDSKNIEKPQKLSKKVKRTFI